MKSARRATLAAFFGTRAAVIRDYMSAISGSAGRLVFSLVYFVALANTLTIAEFGLAATASAVGVMLSRIVGFGFITTLYRIATVRRRLLGVYAGGFLMLAAASAPVVAAATWGVHALLFSRDMALLPFALIVAAECFFWRPVEAVTIVNNGLGRFGRASILVIIGIALRSVAALVLMMLPVHDLLAWSWLYLGANGLALGVAVFGFLPSMRLRFMPHLYWRRLPDSLYVAGAEILFYLQSELDKLLVLSLGGAHLAGVYAIVIRVVDLTAIPVRTFTMMLVQRIMARPNLLESLLRRAGIEFAIFAVSTLGLATLALILHFFPTLLGANVAEVTPLLMLALFVPGLRNLVEYQAELLFARGQTLIRAINLALIAALKFVLLSAALQWMDGDESLILSLNWAFAGLYVASAALTYSAMRLPARAL